MIVDDVQITEFVAPEETVVIPMNNPSRVADSVIRQSIQDFISRPYRIDSVQWKTTDLIGSSLTFILPLESVLSRATVWNKLANFKYFRCGAKLRFQVTGNLFLGGKLRAWWIPVNRDPSVMSLTSVTGIRQAVDIYPSDNGTYELNVPMFYPYRYFDLAAIGTYSNSPTTATLGAVVLTVVSPLISDDVSDTVHISTFVSLTDVELADVYTPLVYSKPDQSTYPGVSVMSNCYSSDLFAARRYVISNCSRPTVNDPVTTVPLKEVMEFNVGQRVMPTPLEERIKQGTRSLVSGVVGGIVNPIVSPVTSLASSVSATVSNVTKMLGSFLPMDKPLIRDIPTSYQTKYADLSRGDGASTAFSTSLLSGNSVDQVGEASVVDPAELSISYLCSTPQLLATATVTTDTQPLTNLIGWAVTPANEPVSTDTHTTSLTLHGRAYQTAATYASFFSKAFEYWRGDFVVDLEVVAQGPSKCSVGVTWVPGTVSPYNYSQYPTDLPKVTEDYMSAGYTTVINVSGTTKGQLVIPFVNQQYALSTNLQVVGEENQPNAIGGSSMAIPVHNGFVVIYLINSLTSFSPSGPGTNPVQLLMYGSWRNLRFYKPDIGKCNSDRQTTNFSDSYGPFIKYPALAQPTGGTPVSNMFFNSYETREFPPSFLFGEEVDNVLHLVRRPGVGAVPYVGSGWSDIDLGQLFYSFYSSLSNTIYPLSSSGNQWTAGSTGGFAGKDDTYPVPGSFLNYFRTIYLGARGSVIYTPFRNSDSMQPFDGRALSMTATVANRSWSSLSVNKTAPAVVPAMTSYAGKLASGNVYRAHNNPLDPPQVHVPYYSQMGFIATPCYKRSNPSALGTDPTIGGLKYNQSIPGVNITFNPSTTRFFSIFEEAGDDFAFSTAFPPPVVASYVGWVPPMGLGPFMPNAT